MHNVPDQKPPPTDMGSQAKWNQKQFEIEALLRTNGEDYVYPATKYLTVILLLKQQVRFMETYRLGRRRSKQRGAVRTSILIRHPIREHKVNGEKES